MRPATSAIPLAGRRGELTLPARAAITRESALRFTRPA